MPQERCFQLVKNVLKACPPGYLFETKAHFATDEWVRISGFITSLSGTSNVSGVFVLVLHHKDNELRSICRKLKSQDNFNAGRLLQRMPPTITIVFSLHHPQPLAMHPTLNEQGKACRGRLVQRPWPSKRPASHTNGPTRRQA